MDNRPNRSTDPGGKPVHTGHTAPTPGPPRDNHPTHEHTTVDRAPNGTSTASRKAPRARHAYIPSNASPIFVTTRLLTPRIPSLPHTHSPHPKLPIQANLTPPGQAAHLRSMRISYSFAQGGSRGNRAGQATGTPRLRPHKLYPGTPGNIHPRDAPSTSPLD